MKKTFAITALSLSVAFSSAHATTIVHWTFDSFPVGTNNISSVTSNDVTLGQGTETRRPSATSTVPSAHSAQTVSALFSAAQSDHLISDSTVPALNFDAGESFTVEGWFNLSATSADYNIISNRGSSAVGNAGFALLVASADKKLQFQVDAGPTNTTVRTSFEISTDTWYFFAASRDSSGTLLLSVYNTEGILGSWASTSVVGGALVTDRSTAIGKSAISDNNYFDGYISEIRISEGVIAAQDLLWTTTIPEPATFALLSGLFVLTGASMVRRQGNRR